MAAKKVIGKPGGKYTFSSLPEATEQGRLIIDSDDILLVLDGINGPIKGTIKKEDFDKIRGRVLSDLDYTQLQGATVINHAEGVSYDYSDVGTLAGRRSISTDEQMVISITDCDMVDIDIFGKPIHTEDVVKIEKKSKDFSGLKQMNIARLILSFQNHREYFNTLNEPLVDDEAVLDKLVKTAILQSDQFDEIFTTEKDRPESPLMVKFMHKLSELVNDQLRENTDEGIDNLEELQKKAYDYASYQGKDFETVVRESKDYYNYFRYLLTKGEKIVISENQGEYFKSLLKVSERIKATISKTRIIDYEISDIVPGSFLYYFTEKIPSIRFTKEKIQVSYFTYVSKIREASFEIESYDLTLKIALINEMLYKEFSDEVKAGITIDHKIIVVDQFCNYMTLSVKKATLSKWLKTLNALIATSNNVNEHGNGFKPYGIDDTI